jgi:hypothetical protein
MRKFCTVGLAVALLAPQAAFAGDELKWETVATGAITVKSRGRPNSPVKDVWAEGEIAAPVQDIQSTLMESDQFPSFMPYVKESRHIGKPDADGTKYVYTRLELPVVTSRDYVLKVNLIQGVNADGTGEFRNHWEAAPDKLPVRASVVRLKINEGTWHVTPKGEGKSWAVYKFAVDPGGWIPAFAADMGNKGAVTDTFKCVEKEAARRAAERKAQASKP